jgi:hypothetical protein
MTLFPHHNFLKSSAFTMSSEVTASECVCTFSFPGFSKLGSAKREYYNSVKAVIGEYGIELRIYSGGSGSAIEGKMSCFLYNASSKPLSCEFRLDLMTQETVAQTFTCVEDSFGPSTSRGWSNFALRSFILDPANRVLSNDCLRIRASLTFATPILLTVPALLPCVETSDSYVYKAGSESALTDLLSLHEAESGSQDFTVISGAPTIAAEGTKKKAPP